MISPNQSRGCLARWGSSDGRPVSRGQIAPRITCPHFMPLSYSLPDVGNIALPRRQHGLRYGPRPSGRLFLRPRPKAGLQSVSAAGQTGACTEPSAPPPPPQRRTSSGRETQGPSCRTRGCHMDKQSEDRCRLLNVMGCHPPRNLRECTAPTDAGQRPAKHTPTRVSRRRSKETGNNVVERCGSCGIF